MRDRPVARLMVQVGQPIIQEGRQDVIVLHLNRRARRVGSDGSMSAFGSAGPGLDPRWGSKF